MQKSSKEVVYLDNLTALTAVLAIGEEALSKVLGGEETSTHLGGVNQETRDLQELLASRVVKQLGV